MSSLRPILLVETTPKDVEPTLAALRRLNFADAILAVDDGAEAFDFRLIRSA